MTNKFSFGVGRGSDMKCHVYVLEDWFQLETADNLLGYFSSTL